ncbi:MAG: hypothetical protein Q8O89_04765 [Nanoarchaeota archaeon]|nr:hypothetical protein [Nanoarchaeota archaeon]
MVFTKKMMVFVLVVFIISLAGFSAAENSPVSAVTSASGGGAAAVLTNSSFSEGNSASSDATTNLTTAATTIATDSAKALVDAPVALPSIAPDATLVTPATTLVTTDTIANPVKMIPPVPAPARPVYRGFRYAKWECYDGKKETQGSESSCKPSELWQKYAQEACAGHCYADNSKCGVNSYSVGIECGDETAVITPTPPTIIPTNPDIAIPNPNSGISVISVSDVEVCYKKLKQENPGEKEDLLWMKCKLMTRQMPAVTDSGQPTTTVPTATAASVQQCESANEQLMNELNNAAQKYDTIKREGRSDEDLKGVQEYIMKIKEKMQYNKNNCWTAATQVASNSERPECEIVNANLKKELEEGYIKTRLAQKEGDPERIKEIDNYMMQLKNKVMKNRESCWDVKTSGGETNAAAAPVIVSTSWVSTETKPSDVITYYQAKMGSILEDEKSIDSQIIQLKDLRNKIDVMIEELIKKKEVIGADDFNGLVQEFKINSKEISADDLKFDSVNKEFVKNIGDKSVSIKQGEDNVVLTVDNVQVNAPEFTITDVIRVDDIELIAMPDEIRNQVKEDIKDVQVVRENDKLIYNVKTEEERKILGLFSATAEKNTVLDASSENATLIKEETPWWFGISTEVKG